MERGALRAGMWLLIGQSYVRTANEKQACQPEMHLQGARHSCKGSTDTFFSQDFCTENGLNLKHAKTTADFQKKMPPKRKMKCTGEIVCERLPSNHSFQFLHAVSFP